MFSIKNKFLSFEFQSHPPVFDNPDVTESAGFTVYL